MKTNIAAIALTVAASTGAFAQSSALDSYTASPVNGPVAIAVASPSDNAVRGRLGDGSPMYELNDASAIDFTATASIGAGQANFDNNRLYFGNN